MRTHYHHFKFPYLTRDLRALGGVPILILVYPNAIIGSQPYKPPHIIIGPYQFGSKKSKYHYALKSINSETTHEWKFLMKEFE